MAASPDQAARTPARSEGGRFEGLDALRAVAATCIVLYHTILLNSLALPAWSTELVYRLGMAVPLFYMLSAFSLSIGYYGKLQNRAALAQYGVRRFLRIAPLFYVLLPVWLTVMWVKFDQAPSFFAIIANLTFLFGFVPGLHESIAWAGWSIGVEMIFYALLPLIFLAARDWRSSLALYGASIIAAIAFQKAIGHATSYAYMNIITQLPHFMTGLVAFHVYRSGVLSKLKDAHYVLLAIGLAIWPLMAVLKLGHLTVWGVDVEQYGIGLAFPFIVLSQVLSPDKVLVNRFSVFLGKRSFSIYLLHPLMILLAMPLVQAANAAHGSKIAAPEGFLVVMLLVTAAASITYRLIETPGMNLGRKTPGSGPSLPAASF
jgi:peptidoglycan/LPS O-acetylase OafA/YrhL